MRLRSPVLAVVAAVLSFPGAAAAIPPLDGDGKTTAVYSYAGAVRERIFVTLNAPFVDQDRNGTADRVTFDIIRPSEANAGNKIPAIVLPSPYYTTTCRGNEGECMGDVDDDGVNDRWPMFYDNYFVPRGYAVVLAQMNGTGYTTSGCPHHGGAGDIASMTAVVDWLNGRRFGVNGAGNVRLADWHNGSAAMIGKSYDGTLSNGSAATGVDGLKTIVPISAISDWYRYSRTGGIRHNTDYPRALNRIVTHSTANPTGDNLPDRLPTCEPVNLDFNALDGDDTGDYNAFWDERDYTQDVGNVDASVLAVHGFQDDNVRMDHLWEWWNGLADAGVTRKLWLLRSGHTDPFDARRTEWLDTLHRWLDHWLWGVENGIEDAPAVTIEDEKDVWGEYASWPVPGTEDVPLFLQATAEATAAGVVRGTAGGPLDNLAFTNILTTLGSSIPGTAETNAINNPSGSQASRRVFLSRPLLEDIRLSGRAVVELQASLNATQSNLGAIVVDYGPAPFAQVTRTGDGTQDLTTTTCIGPAHAYDRNCWREIAKPTQSVTQWRVTRGILDSSNRDSLRAATPAVLGQEYGFSIPLQPTEHTFKAGHRIGIVVVGNLYGIAGTPGAQITVDTQLSRVMLPIAGGAAAARVSGLTDESAATTTATLPGGGGGWLREGTAVTLAADDGDGSGVASITYATSGAAASDPQTVAGASAEIPIGAEGSTTVRFAATDRAGNVEPEQTLVVNVDGAAPVVACAPGDDRWHAANVELACTASDAASGLADPGAAAFSIATAVAPGAEDAQAATAPRTICDVAGNCATAGGSSHRVDLRPPSVAFGAPGASVFARGAAVRARFACADGGSGVASCAGARALDTATAGARRLTVTASDAAGNRTTAARRYTVLGRLPKLRVRKRAGNGLRLALTSRVRTTVRMTGTLARAGIRVPLKSRRVTLRPGVAKVVVLRGARRLGGEGRITAALRLASKAGALKRTDRGRWRFAG